MGGLRNVTPRRSWLLVALVSLAVVAGVAVAIEVRMRDLGTRSADCGQEGFRSDGSPDQVRRCILDAYERRTSAYSAHVRETMEGDPITYRIRVHGRDEFDLSIDWTKDRFGSGLGIKEYRCAGMRGGDGSTFVLRVFNCGAGVAVLDL
jgi:hypothetical protein